MIQEDEESEGDDEDGEDGESASQAGEGADGTVPRGAKPRRGSGGSHGTSVVSARESGRPALLGDGRGVIGVLVVGDATGAVFILRYVCVCVCVWGGGMWCDGSRCSPCGLCGGDVMCWGAVFICSTHAACPRSRRARSQAV